jgi:CelD/BcsL family acetyltransferase involved in cellulose biosynthesis
MRVDVVKPQDLTKQHLAVWRDFQSRDELLSNPFLCPEFICLASSVRQNLRVAIAQEDGVIKGFLPFEQHRKVGRPIGGRISDCQAVVAAQGWNWNASDLVRAAGLSALDFHGMRTEQRPFAKFHWFVAASPVINLKNGFEAYAADLRAEGRNVVAKTMSDTRRLARELGPVRFVLHDSSLDSLYRVIAWKRKQYRLTGMRDIFMDPSIIDLLERIQKTQMPTFAGVLSTLWAGDTLVAGHMGMRSSSNLQYWFPAYDSMHSKLAPGRILLLELIRKAPAIGVKSIELGEGSEDYKIRFANSRFFVASGFVGSPPLMLRSYYILRKIETVVSRWPAGLSLAVAARRCRSKFRGIRWPHLDRNGGELRERPP